MYIEVNWSAGKLIQRKEVTCPKELEGFSANHAQVSQNMMNKLCWQSQNTQPRRLVSSSCFHGLGWWFLVTSSLVNDPEQVFSRNWNRNRK